jgi:hypothetical protein
VYSSPDGTTWTGLTASGPPGANGLAWSGTRLVTVGGSINTATPVAPIQASLDGVTWTVVSPPAWTGVDYFEDVIWSGTQFLAVGGPVTNVPQGVAGGAGLVATSPDGLTWTQYNTSQFLENVVWSGSQFVAVGATAVQTSPDGITWTDATSATPDQATLLGAVWSGTEFTAVSLEGSIYQSPDGTSWTTAFTNPPNPGTSRIPGFYCIAWSGTLYAACTDYGFVTSPDGVTWTFRPALTATSINSILWSGSQFVAVGTTGNVLTSPDGVTWTAQTTPAVPSHEFTSVAWSGKRYVIGGFSGLLTSPDAVTWTTTGVPGSWVVWTGTQFVASSYQSGSQNNSNVLTSPDGVVWTQHTIPFGFAGGGFPNSFPFLPQFIWTGTQLLAEGCTNNAALTTVCDIFTSSDGVTWSVTLSKTYPYSLGLLSAVSSGSKTIMDLDPFILSLP